MNSLHLKKRPRRLVASPTGSAAEALHPITPGFSVVVATLGQFTLLDIIRALLNVTGPAAVTFSTWTCGRADVEHIGALYLAGGITRMRMLCDRSFPLRHPQYVGVLQRVFGEGNIRCTRTHAKFAIVRNDAWNVCVRTSMNLNVNRRFEQADIDDDDAICDFFERIADEVFEDVPPGLPPPSPAVYAQLRRAMRSLSGRGASTPARSVDDFLTFDPVKL